MDHHARIFSLSLLLLAAAPLPAAADGWVSGFIGTVFGGDAGGDFSRAVEDPSKTTYGFTLGGMSAGVFGAELDVGYTPDFFGGGGVVDSSGVLTAMGNLLLGVPIGGQSGPGIRPYGSVGLGLLRRNVDFTGAFESVDSTDFGYNLGGGLMGFFVHGLGIRVDYRYYRNFDADEDGFLGFDTGTFDFSRASIGLMLRW